MCLVDLEAAQNPGEQLGSPYLAHCWGKGGLHLLKDL